MKRRRIVLLFKKHFVAHLFFKNYCFLPPLGFRPQPLWCHHIRRSFAMAPPRTAIYAGEEITDPWFDQPGVKAVVLTWWRTWLLCEGGAAREQLAGACSG
ncbi:hypothetical protein V6Z11_D05G381500 [Gossypium hirsutum]